MRLFVIVYWLGFLGCLAYLGKEAQHLEREDRLPYIGCMSVLSLMWPVICVWMLYETIAVWVHIRKSKGDDVGGKDEH